jgi:hypothetical protein
MHKAPESIRGHFPFSGFDCKSVASSEWAIVDSNH